MTKDKAASFGTTPSGDQKLSDPAAELLVAQVLEGVGKAIKERDFLAFAAHLALPYTVSTSQRRQVIDEIDGLEQMFRRSTEYLDHDGVSEMSRRILSANFVDDQTIWTLLETRLVHFGSQIRRAPYYIHCELRWDKEWLFTSGHYSISDDPLHSASLVPGT